MSNSDSNKDSLTNDLTTLYNNIFSKNTAILLIWFLALNFVCYHLLKFFFNNNIESLDYQSKLARLLDICIFIFLLLFLIASYYSMSEEDKEISIQNLGTSTINYINDADSIYKTIVFILFFYCIIYLFRIPMNYQTKPYFIAIIEFVAWVLLLIIIFVKFFNDVFGFSMLDIISSFFNWSNLSENSNDVNPVVLNAPAVPVVTKAQSNKPSLLSVNTISTLFPSIKNLISLVTPKNTMTPNPTPAPKNTMTPNPTPAPKNTTTPNPAATPNTTSAPKNTTTPNPAATPTMTTTPLTNNITVNTSTTNSLTNNSQSGFQNIFEGFDSSENTQSSAIPISNNQELAANIIETDKAEVFNVKGNFTYDDAQVVCAAYGGKLANYDQIETVYNSGGEWCNYGWSEGQYGYFPTQKSTWEKLQKSTDPKIRQSCGRQGINGGYVNNPAIQMGINCFGPKPELKDNDLLASQQQTNTIFAKSKQELELDNKIQFWKQEIANGNIVVNQYNRDTWSHHENPSE